MKVSLAIFIALAGLMHTQALIINEILSNPVGTDNGREWVELYNDGTESVDLSGVSVATTETGTAVPLILLAGEITLPAGAYAIIGTIVSGQTKFLEDYPTYSGVLFRTSGSFSLTNGSASLYIRSGSNVLASVPSYTAAGEGQTLSFVSGSYVAGTPTPGAKNEATGGSGGAIDTGTTTTTLQTENQTTISQATPPSPDIVMYIPGEKLVVAGAESEFSVSSATRAGKEIQNVVYTWAFGDGGSGVGSSTLYRYAYTGRYVAVVEGISSTVRGTGRIAVRVVAPDIKITNVGSGKYGSYVDVTNPDAYDIDVSQWRLQIDGIPFTFPKNTLILADSTTRFSGLAMGFASTTIATSTVVKILFPSQEEIVRFSLDKQESAVFLSAPTVLGVATTTESSLAALPAPKPIIRPVVAVKKVETIATGTPPVKVVSTRDTRIVSWLKTLFGGE